MMKKLTIKQKFFLFLFFVVTIVGVVTLLGLFYIGDADNAFHSSLIRENNRIAKLFEMNGAIEAIEEISMGEVTYNKDKITESLVEFASVEQRYRESIAPSEKEEIALLDEIGRIKSQIVTASLSYKEKLGTTTDVFIPDVVISALISELREVIQNAVDEKIAYMSVQEKISQTKEQRARGVLFLLSLSVLGAVAWFGFFIRLNVMMPLDNIREDMKRIANKEHPALIPVSQDDEVGEIGRFFNTMVEKLTVSDTSLKQKKEESESKARALEEQVSETEKTKLAVLNLLEDIEGEKKNAENMVMLRTKELSEEKARLLASIGSLSLGFVIANEKNELLLKNPAIDHILGITEDTASLHEIVGRIGEFNILDACQKSMEQRQVVEKAEISYGKKYLRFFCAPTFEENTGLTKNETAKAIGYVFLLEDITEAKVMERSRDEFFAIASHELRTPLTAIRGNVSMILDMYAEKIVDTDMKDMLNDVNESSVRLISIVNDFIEVSRIEQGKVETKKEVFNLSDVVSKVTRDLQVSISKKNLGFHFEIPTGLPQVNADKGQVEQILVNLVGNAMKFTFEGSISLEIKEFGDFVKIAVSDTGVGISEHNQALLFRKFQQAGEKVLARDASQSSGLGLYISRLLAVNMGGNIELEKSELGKGSTFSFTIPIAK